MRGAYLLSSLRGAARVLAISARTFNRADARGLFDGLGHEGAGNAAQLQVELETR